LRPQHAAERGEGVEEARCGLGGVPGPWRPGRPGGVGGEVPAPDGGVQPQGQRGGAFGSAAFPGLGGLAAEVLFDVAEADLDGPAGGV